MVTRKIMLSFPEELLKEPIIYNLGHQFQIMTNIHRADVSENTGWIVLELEGEGKAIEDGIAWVTSKGVRVDPLGEES